MQHPIKEYSFNTKEIIKAGFAHIEGVKAQFLIAIMIYFAIAIVVQTLLSFVFPQSTVDGPNFLNQQIVGILSYPVLMPMMAGIMMMAINHTRGEEIHFKSIFNYYHLTGKLALAGIFSYFLTILGLLLFILPGIYLSVAYAFVMPLIADKGMDVWEAMEHSRKTVTKHWFMVAGLTGALSVILFLGALALGVGLIWAIPLLFVTLYGLAYPVMFDEEE